MASRHGVQRQPPPELVARILGWIRRRLAMRRNRLILRELSDEQLRDIAVSRCGSPELYRRLREE
ncbi:DUF1127 domain-containing protein [Chelativorans sp.]|uniref:DUF1127 domain-containing protein n=1 Tax=Chelativorans sp. TaxID=2203393 RepID=UPI0028128643|nr:DUF1127 domain-containing protein [Chelativorans sp.]